jgi:hypothetical protein
MRAGRRWSGTSWVETTASMVLSRLGCYAALALLAIVLLILAGFQPGSQEWAAMQLSQGSLGSHGLHLSQALGSAKFSVWALRRRMHNTWFFLYVFLAAWAIVVAWALIERHRLKLEIGWPEVYWMGWMSLSVISTAILYGLGTNGILARRQPRAVPISDALALGFVLTLPVFAWSRLHRRREEDLEEEPEIHHRRMFTTLQLEPEPSFAGAPGYSRESVVREPRMEVAAQPMLAAAPRAMTIVTMDGLAGPAPGGQSLIQERLPEPAMVPQTAPSQPALHQFAPESAPAFRNHLRTLNESWARIERTGQEIEQWFDQQRQQVISHLEMHPGARGSSAPPQLSKDFLSERLAAVDAEWAAIRQAALEITRWFGDAPAPGKTTNT